MGNLLAQNGYTKEDVMKLLVGSRKIDFEYELLDNQERMLGTVNAAGSVSFNSSSEVMGTASFEIQEGQLKKYAGLYMDMRVRPCFKLFAPGGWLKYPLGIYILSSPRRKEKDNTIYWEVEAYDKGIILKEDKLTDRLYIPAGSNYIAEVKKILLSAGIDKFIIENSTLSTNTDLEFEIGTSKVEAANELLYAINYYPIHFDYRGFAETSRYIEPMQRETEFGYMTDDNSIVLPGTSQGNDMYGVPNVVIRYLDNPDEVPLRSIYRNDDPGSIVSTVRRGRQIVDVESVEDIADQDTLDAYTRRIAIEKSQMNDTVSLQTALMPMHGFRNCLFVRDDKLGIETKYIEYAWSMELKVGGVMQHELKRVMYL